MTFCGSSCERWCKWYTLVVCVFIRVFRFFTVFHRVVSNERKRRSINPKSRGTFFFLPFFSAPQRVSFLSVLLNRRPTAAFKGTFKTRALCETDREERSVEEEEEEEEETKTTFTDENAFLSKVLFF